MKLGVDLIHIEARFVSPKLPRQLPVVFVRDGCKECRWRLKIRIDHTACWCRPVGQYRRVTGRGETTKWSNRSREHGEPEKTKIWRARNRHADRDFAQIDANFIYGRFYSFKLRFLCTRCLP